MPMRIVFLGTPEFAVPSLRALAERHQVTAVFTQPDRPKGRGNNLAESSVKIAARALELPVYQPDRIRRAPNPEFLKNMAPDLMVVVGYGQIIPQEIIDIPRHGILNVHASLLPAYRGAAPVQWAIANGEIRTGVTIMRIDAGLDTGDMLLAQIAAIEPDETAPELSERLADIGAALLIDAIGRVVDGSVEYLPQDETQATLAPILKKEDGLLEWGRPAPQLYNRLRGFTPWPGAYTFFRGEQLKIMRACVDGSDGSLAAGELRTHERRLLVGCGNATALEILELQMAGKSRMKADVFLNGHPEASGTILGEKN